MATGHIRKRAGTDGSVSYQLVVEGERDPLTGKRERTYKTIKGTKKQAEATLRKMIADVEAGGIITQSAMKLADWLDQWLENYLPNIEETTRAGYKEKIDSYIKPKLGNIPLNALKNNNVQTWINELSKRGLSPKTIRNAFNNLNAAMKKAVVLRMIPYNPCQGAELPKLQKYQAEVYDGDDIRRALEAAKDTDMYLILLVSLAIGSRRGEIDALKWEHIDFEHKTISISDNRVHGNKTVITKSPKSAAGRRKIKVGDAVIAELAKAKIAYFRDREEVAGFQDLGYVIRKQDGTPYHPDSITSKWQKFLKKHNLKHIRFHDLRHSHATALIQAGVSPKVVQQRLGHADVNITLNTYTHVLPSMDQEAADTIDDIIFAEAGNN